ncbi:alpha-amylase family protein [Spirosoma utsteinense]|uniref:Maltose alpha-D-glucosyltransferase/alpha-amylase n=1 Tax=Spirosoma utsteinense TaxID=2585773 RepID=A0ABR6W6K8_9BACT|nr:alpha-amylase family protein [Spirosoma utsteinense]MBC3787884.1 maltose alpha-D-glucosyltransferase/alpha-amylase [Spirosoma utsteinense]MBC3792195.1 maltose alpha-D-glucosyltransferase/alpha-amylase [Spirosoma utsteinense]
MKKIILFLGICLLASCRQTTSETEKPETTVAPPAPLPTDFIEELWYKNSLVYSVDVEVFKDSDKDGVGDFRGMSQQLDYLKKLGVETIWLAPFQPTPNLDDGYDTSDFYGIDPRLGTPQDFTDFMNQASQRGIRVMMDLVTNHTSDQHPWFQQARRQKDSPYRSWYVWSKERPEKWNTGMVFPGVQKSVWSYDSLAGEYYYHRFYESQPDLNMQNPAVQREMRKVIRYWLDKGVAGFRVDAVPFLIEVATPDFDPDKPQHQFDMITQLHQYVQWHKRDAILLGEANVDPKEQEPYFGKEGQGMQTMFNFFANQHLFYALATTEVSTLKKALNETKSIPPTAQWATFLRNHDEIDLGRLSDEERGKVYAKFGPDSSMQLYDRGIRRRLAPMLGDPRLIKLAYSLLFSLPGMPVIRYGEEIGMGDDLSLEERLSVRTPMQWSNKIHGGFSEAAKAVRPVISAGPYRYSTVNVAAQQADSASLLNHITRLSSLRKQCPEVGWGKWEIIDTKSPHVLAIRYNWQGRSLVMIHNFSPQPQQNQLHTDPKAGLKLVDLLAKSEKQIGADGNFSVDLPAYGFKWYRVKK